MAVVVGFAFWGLSATPVGKRVFLLIVATIPNAMLSMTTTAGMVQKAAVGGKKKPGCSPEQKQLLAEAQPNHKPLPWPSPREGTEKLKPTIKLKVDDGETAVLPFIICLF